MSQSNHPRAGLRYGEPAGRAIVTYDNYAGAEAAVDHLADRHFRLLNITVYAMQRGRRDFATTRAMQPSRYNILADAEVADQAVRELEAVATPQSARGFTAGTDGGLTEGSADEVTGRRGRRRCAPSGD
jgi:hypothetical protein